MRWAVPHLKQQRMLLYHDDCKKHPCVKCSAEQNLLTEDWMIVQFFGRVQDQAMPLNPMGDEQTHDIHLAPRLDVWLKIFELYEYPGEWRLLFIEQARFLFEALHGRIKRHEILGPSGELP